MTWIHPAFLFALALVAGPILLHFLTRRTYRTYDLPTFEFLRRAVETRQRASRLREILLMLLRAAAVAGIVVTVARPTKVVSEAPRRKEARNIVLVLDNTFSMNARWRGRTLLEHAREAAHEQVSRLSAGSRAAVVALVEKGETPQGFTDDRGALHRRIDSVSATYQTSHAQAVLSREIDRLGATEFDVFTDRNGSTWKEGTIGDGAAGTLVLRDVRGTENLGNSRVDGVGGRYIVQGENAVVEITVRLATFAEEKGTRALTLYRWDGKAWKPVDRKLVTLGGEGEAGTNETTHRFSAKEDGQAWIGKICLEEDLLPEDNCGFIVLAPFSPIDVAVINGDPRPEPRLDAAGYVLAALRPAGAGRMFRVEEMLVDPWDAAGLRGKRAVIAADVAGLSDRAVRDLASYVAQGGALWIGAGPTFERVGVKMPVESLLSAPFRGVHVPAKPLHLESLEPGEAYRSLGEEWIKTMRKSETHRLVTTAAVSSEEVWLSYEGGLPALVVSSNGMGRVALWTTSFGLAWSNVAVNAGFAAFVRETIAALSTPSGPNASSLRRVRVGDSVLVDEEAGAAATVPLRRVGERDRFLPDLKGDRFSSPDLPGLWEPESSEATESSLLVEIDPEESDLRPVPVDEIARSLGGFHVRWAMEGVSVAAVGGGESRRDLSSRLGFWILLLFFAESLFAGRPPAWLWRRRGIAGFLLGFLLTVSNAHALGERSRIEIGQVHYSGGNSTPYPRPMELLLRKLPRMTSVEPVAQMASVRLSDPRLFEYPLLYWSGDRTFPLPSAADLGRLRRHLQEGGFLFIDDALGSEGEFSTSVESLAKALFPDRAFAKIPKEHSLFRSFFLLDRASGRRPAGTLRGVDLAGRTALVYFSADLAGGLEAGNMEALRFGVNVVFYALTLDYKQDQIHLPFLLRRRP